MYGWIWRHLPGPTAIRALEALLLIVAAVALLFLVVFPWAQRSIPFLDVTVDQQSAPAAASTPAQASEPTA